MGGPTDGGQGGTEAPRVGAGVRRRRRARELTLAELARRTGLSAPFLSQVENDRARPSMRSLQLIADALDTTAVRLLAAADGPRTVDVVRAGSAAVPEAGDEGGGDEGGGVEAGGGERGAGGPGRVRPLVRGRQQLHALEFTGRHDWQREFRHPHDELMYVVEGAVEAEAAGEAYELGPGDTLYCSGGVTHRWRALTSGTRVLLVGVADDFPHR
ncbi:helix-turn-helix domain-containing protein [Streptomyces endophytica]|uniref:Helix-turn-helix domain-containing protein n=1 Tax=Streptomyces endophytica TaxID=2991496 RepID=A0ABY6PEA0_9ACTN|nr:helix-turn-helix transcriptional regulator [Streptomyces endophytica]UZJ32198.1 helix-turn-helix domain-containing protein [Streptomyces endophytica]